MKYILGEKIGMTQIFQDDGKSIPATVIRTGKMAITQIKTKEKDGYNAVQVGYGNAKAKNISKPVKGHLKDLGNFKFLRETKIQESELAKLEVGNQIEVDLFSVGDKVFVRSISKGKGFQGVVKRHGFKGGRRTHGQKHSEREPGSIGGGGRAGGRVVKGMRMAGRMGSEKVKIKNLTILGFNVNDKYLIVSGAVPGRRGTLVEISG